MPDFDRRGGSADRGRPISTLAAAGRRSVGQEYAPRIELVVGRDGYSGGIALTAYVVDDGAVRGPVPLFCHRWQAGPQSYEECLQVAYRGLLAFFEESGISPA